jgi:hypothetical protein
VRSRLKKLAGSSALILGSDCRFDLGAATS